MERRWFLGTHRWEGGWFLGGETHEDEIPVLQQELPSFPALQEGRAVQGELLAERQQGRQFEEGLN